MTLALLVGGSRRNARERCSLSLFDPLRAVFVGGVAVDGVEVVEGVSAEVLAVVFENDPGSVEVVGGVAAGLEGAVPGEGGLIEFRFNFLHACLGRFLGHVVDPEGNEAEEDLALGGGEVLAHQAAGFGLEAILPSAGCHFATLVALDGYFTLFLVEAVDEVVGEGRFLFHRDDFLVPDVEAMRLGADEGGGDGHFFTDDGEVVGDVVAVELDAPEFGFGRGAEDGHPEVGGAEAAAAFGLLLRFEEEVISEHDVAGLDVALRAHDRGEEGGGLLELLLVQVTETKASHVGFRWDVRPDSPFLVVEGKEELFALLGSERFDETLRGGDHGLGGMVGLRWLGGGEDFTGEGERLVGLGEERGDAEGEQERGDGFHGSG